jgi:hypothetical protein
LWLRDLIPVNLLSTWGERLVGVMFFGIGIWALRRALKHNVHTHKHEHDGERHVHVHVHDCRQHERLAAHRHIHTAFAIGTLHGLAGSSHFVGVLPMLALPTRTEAFGYLLAFGTGTILAMAIFSCVIGLVATRCAAKGDRMYRGLMSACSVAAMAVGCFWLATSWR